MRVISPKAIREFCRLHPRSCSSLEDWYRTTKAALWDNFIDVRNTFRSADLVNLGGGRGQVVVFDIAGNHYRLIARINYRLKIVYIRRIMTHAEYDDGDWKDDDDI